MFKQTTAKFSLSSNKEKQLLEYDKEFVFKIIVAVNTIAYNTNKASLQSMTL
jgi:hypothetical protein